MAISVVALATLAARQGDTFRRLDLGPAAWRRLAGAVGLHLTASLVAAGAWVLWLRSLTSAARPRGCFRAHLLSQVGKYVPGNWGHLLGRVVLSARSGAPVGSALAAVLLESTWILACAFVWLTFLPMPERWPGASTRLLAVVGWAVLLVGTLAPSSLLTALRNGARRFSLPGLSSLATPGRRTFVACLGLYTTQFVLGGLSLALLSRGLFGRDPGGFLYLAGVFALAWSLGFVTPGAPGGLGVREAILVGQLGPSGLTAGEAIALAAALRVATILGDAVASLAGLALRPE